MITTAGAVVRNNFFEDVEIGPEITLDIDLFVGDWIERVKEPFLEDIRDIEDRFDTSIRVEYRESSNQNVHIRLIFDRTLSMLEVMIIRAWLNDDQKLLYIDMKRYFKTLDKDNRFMRRFDCKGKINDRGIFEISNAGPWITIR